MFLSKYQPKQDRRTDTAPDTVYAGAPNEVAQLKTDDYKFIRALATDQNVRRIDAGGQAVADPFLAGQDPRPIYSMIAVPTLGAPDYRLQLLQQWEGVVRSVRANNFCGRYL